jgi:hypothetical protein
MPARAYGLEDGRIVVEGTLTALHQEAYLGMRAAADDSFPGEASGESAPHGASRVG